MQRLNDGLLISGGIIMLAKGLMLLGSVVAGGAALAAAPVLTVSAPFWGIMGTTYTVNGVAAAGAAAAKIGRAHV